MPKGAPRAGIRGGGGLGAPSGGLVVHRGGGGRDRLARPGVRLLPRRAPPHRVRQGRQVPGRLGGGHVPPSARDIHRPPGSGAPRRLLGPHHPHVHDGRDPAPHGGRVRAVLRHRVRARRLARPVCGRALQPGDERGGAPRRRHVRRGRLRERARPPFRRGRELEFSWGEPATDPASSTCRTASRWTPPAPSTSPTARTPASSSSRRRASTCGAGTS